MVNPIFYLSSLATYNPASHRKLLSHCPTWCWQKGLHISNAQHDLEMRFWPAVHMLSEEARTHQLGSLEDDRRGPVHHQKPQVESCPNSPWKGSLPSLHIPEQQSTVLSVTFGSRYISGWKTDFWWQKLKKKKKVISNQPQIYQVWPTTQTSLLQNF